MAKTRESLPNPDPSPSADPSDLWQQIRKLLDCNPPNIDEAASLLAREEQGGRKVAELFAAILSEHRRLQPLADGESQTIRDLEAATRKFESLRSYVPRTLDESTAQADAVDAALREKSRLLNLRGEAFQAVGQVAWCEQYGYMLFGRQRPARILGTMPETLRPFMEAIKADPKVLDSWQPRNASEQPRRRARLLTVDRPRN